MFTKKYKKKFSFEIILLLFYKTNYITFFSSPVGKLEINALVQLFNICFVSEINELYTKLLKMINDFGFNEIVPVVSYTNLSSYKKLCYWAYI